MFVKQCSIHGSRVSDCEELLFCAEIYSCGVVTVPGQYHVTTRKP